MRSSFSDSLEQGQLAVARGKGDDRTVGPIETQVDLVLCDVGLLEGAVDPSAVDKHMVAAVSTAIPGAATARP